LRAFGFPQPGLTNLGLTYTFFSATSENQQMPDSPCCHFLNLRTLCTGRPRSGENPHRRYSKRGTICTLFNQAAQPWWRLSCVTFGGHACCF
jgi:hypothetical protein